MWLCKQKSENNLYVLQNNKCFSGYITDCNLWTIENAVELHEHIHTYVTKSAFLFYSHNPFFCIIKPPLRTSSLCSHLDLPDLLKMIVKTLSSPPIKTFSESVVCYCRPIFRLTGSNVPFQSEPFRSIKTSLFSAVQLVF